MAPKFSFAANIRLRKAPLNRWKHHVELHMPRCVCVCVSLFFHRDPPSFSEELLIGTGVLPVSQKSHSKADPFGFPFLGMAPKGQPFVSGSFGQVRTGSPRGITRRQFLFRRNEDLGRQDSMAANDSKPVLLSWSWDSISQIGGMYETHLIGHFAP